MVSHKSRSVLSIDVVMQLRLVPLQGCVETQIHPLHNTYKGHTDRSQSDEINSNAINNNHHHHHLLPLSGYRGSELHWLAAFGSPGIVTHLVAMLATLRPTHHPIIANPGVITNPTTTNPRAGTRGGTVTVTAGGGNLGARGAAGGDGGTGGGGGGTGLPPWIPHVVMRGREEGWGGSATPSMLLSVTRRALSLHDSCRRRPLDLVLLSGNLEVARVLLQRVGHFCFEGGNGAASRPGLGTAPAQGPGLGSAQGPGLGSAIVPGVNDSNGGVGGINSNGGSVLHYAVMGRSLPCVHLLVRFTNRPSDPPQQIASLLFHHTTSTMLFPLHFYSISTHYLPPSPPSLLFPPCVLTISYHYRLFPFC